MDYDDVELTKDVIKLLQKELKLLRAQLSDANQQLLARSDQPNSAFFHAERKLAVETENTHPKTQVKRLGSELAQSQHITGGDSTSHALQLENVLRRTKDQLVELSEEKERVGEEKDAAISKLQEKCKLNREKYKTQKSANASPRRGNHDVEAQLEEHRRDFENDHTSSGLDPETFLASASVRSYPTGIQPYATQCNINSSGRTFGKILLKTASTTLCYNIHEMVWSRDRISRAVIILPFCRYNPKALSGTGTWEWGRKPVIGERYNLFYRSEEAWLYIGNFKCVQGSPLELERFFNVPDNVKQRIYQRTILFPKLVPKFLSDMVEGMYSKGALRAECFGFEFQHFNEALNTQLCGDGTSSEPAPGIQPKRGPDSGAILKTYSKKQRTL